MMHKVSHKMPSIAGARLTSPQAKPPTPRHSAISALPADVPAYICTSVSGVVTCTDEAGSPVQGEQLKQLQALLKPIADAPSLADEPVKAKGQSMPNTAQNTPEPKMVAQAPAPESSKPAAPVMTPASKSADAAQPSAAPATPSPPAAPKLPTATTVSTQTAPPASPAAPEPSVKTVSEPAQADTPAATPASKGLDAQARPAPTKKASPPTTLATPDLSPQSPGSDVRAIAVAARGNDESVSFSAPAPAPAAPAATPTSSPGSLIPGNSSATPSAPAPAASPAAKPISRSPGSFPGNVDPADYLPEEDFGKPTVTVASAKPPAAAKSGNQAQQPRRLDIVNEKGLIPGNLSMELGEIVNLLQAVNAEPIKYLNYKVYPGNVPPDAPVGTVASTVLEFSPGNAPPQGGDMKAVKMELAPGNIPPDLGDMIEFLKGNES
eukprot:jgi/Ulvmu1/9626/UM054_0056.1